MNTKKAIEIASRIYGLYLLVQIPFALSGLLAVLAVNQNEFLKNPLLYKVWAIIHPLFYIIVAVILIFKAEKISNLIVRESNKSFQDYENGPNYSRLSFWLILLGVYFVISATSFLIRDFIRFPINLGDNYSWSLLLSHGFSVIAGIFLILKHNWLESRIARKVER